MLTESICDDNYRVLDELTDYVNATLLNGIVPSIPFNILIILSEKKVFNPVKSDITSKGYCYQTLIYLALKKAEINDLEFDIYLNFLEYLSFFFFDTNTSSFTLNQYENFITQYGIEYNQPIPIDSLIKKLQISKIFYKNSIGEYHFNSEYIFFFFVAKYLANHKDDSEVNKKIVEIYNSLEIESHGYIGVFIIHHIKDNTILDEIQFNLLLLYEDISEVTLNKDECEFLYNHISELSKLSLKANNSSFKKREERLSIKDKNDEIEKEIQKKNNKRNNDESDSFDINDELSSLRKALRTVEVMGQILKTRTGSFKKDKQKEYFEEAFKVYLRITNRFLLDFKENEQTFLDFFTERINKIEQKKIDESDRYKIAYSTFLNFNIMNFIACIKRTTHTLCSSQILNIVQEVCSEMNTPISKLVSIQSQMWYNKEIPIEQIKKMMTNMEFLEQRILKVLVIDYCELHDVHYRDKQKIASNLDIQLKLLQKDNTK